MGKTYIGTYAGHRLRFLFRHPSTHFFFDAGQSPIEADVADICATDEYIERARLELPEGTKIGYVENQALIRLVGQALLRHDCCIFHSVSFVLDGRAYLLAGPSGIGKTTQYNNWQRLHPGETTMISGDMPVLEKREDGTVWVHPSNWNGKENMGNHVSAPLGGVVMLEQGKENELADPDISETVLNLFRQFVAVPETEDDILSLTGIMDCMLRTVPFWKYANLGDDASTELLRSALMAGGNHGTI